ncbi:MAG TPA: hypothetical protein VGY57_12615, partial [Vicinamibacterales bacterium]|nr:hypothetical protein [Vicinamibacterales bacterium]
MNSAIALVLPALVVVAQAQPERIAMPRGPAPDQTVRVRMTQDMTMTFDPGDAPGAPMPAMTMVMKMIIAQTMKVGPLDDRRRYQAAITIDDATAEMTLNGAAMPMPGGLPLAHGQQFTIQYDEDRAIAGITGDAPASATEMFKKMFETVGRSIPGTPMAVGDTVAVPIALPLPSMPSGPSGDMTGEASMTLKA